MTNQQQANNGITDAILEAIRPLIIAQLELDTAERLKATGQTADELRDLLAAVTAERDRLREELAAVQSQHRVAGRDEE